MRADKVEKRLQASADFKVMKKILSSFEHYVDRLANPDRKARMESVARLLRREVAETEAQV